MRDPCSASYTGFYRARGYQNGASNGIKDSRLMQPNAGLYRIVPNSSFQDEVIEIWVFLKIIPIHTLFVMKTPIIPIESSYLRRAPWVPHVGNSHLFSIKKVLQRTV